MFTTPNCFYSWRKSANLPVRGRLSWKGRSLKSCCRWAAGASRRHRRGCRRPPASSRPMQPVYMSIWDNPSYVACNGSLAARQMAVPGSNLTSAHLAGSPVSSQVGSHMSGKDLGGAAEKKECEKGKKKLSRKNYKRKIIRFEPLTLFWLSMQDKCKKTSKKYVLC
jgi:hypothetical protein